MRCHQACVSGIGSLAAPPSLWNGPHTRGKSMLAPSERKAFIEQYPLLGTIGHTPLVRVDILRHEFPDVEVYAKLEYFNPGGSLKDRPVRQILLDALTSGALHPGKAILDSSSGNAGIAYAMLGTVIGYP